MQSANNKSAMNACIQRHSYCVDYTAPTATVIEERTESITEHGLELIQ
jgi:hypothetical protein